MGRAWLCWRGMRHVGAASLVGARRAGSRIYVDWLARLALAYMHAPSALPLPGSFCTICSRALEL